MIFVKRNVVPATLRSPRALDARKSLYNTLGTRTERHLRQVRTKFDADVWRSVGPKLMALFHGKCAFCESHAELPENGDVGHFRPKSNASTSGTVDPTYYAWLAYEWQNLLLICNECSRAGGSQFPVDGQRAARMASVEECRKVEVGTVIDPTYDEPSVHLAFSPNGRCEPLSLRGLKTIDVFDLNREALVRARANHCKRLRRDLAAAKTSSRRSRSVLLQYIDGVVDSSAMMAGVSRQVLPYFLREVGYSDREAMDILSSTSWKKGRRGIASGAADNLYAPASLAGRPTKKLPKNATRALRRIEIANFKGIDHVAFDIPEREKSAAAGCLVLLGENATGKSSVLEAIAMALLGSEQIRHSRVDPTRFQKRDRLWVNQGLKASVKLFYRGGSESSVELSIDADVIGVAERQTVLLGYGPRRSFPTDKKVIRGSQPFTRVASLFNAAVHIANPASWLMNCRPSQFDAVVRAIRPILMLSDDAVVSRPPPGKRKGGQIMIDLHGMRTPIAHLSEGYQTVLAMSIDIMRELLDYWPDLESARGIVIIDEIDTHLHPRWKLKVLSSLREALPQVQFVVTTHDPLCLRGAFDGEVSVLGRSLHGAIEVVGDLPNVEGLSVEQLLTSEFFGLLSTEHPEFEKNMSSYISLASKSERTAEEERDLLQLRKLCEGQRRMGGDLRSRALADALASVLVRLEAKGEASTRLTDEFVTALVGKFATADSEVST